MGAILRLIAGVGAMSTPAMFGVALTARQQCIHAQTSKRERFVRVGAIGGRATSRIALDARTRAHLLFVAKTKPKTSQVIAEQCAYHFIVVYNSFVTSVQI